MESHLAGCAECRERLAAPALSQAEADLLGAVLRLAAERESAEDATQVASRVADGVRPYLGSRATDELVGAADRDKAKLLAGVEPVLGLFLGRKAAARLVTRVLDHALVRA